MLERAKAYIKKAATIILVCNCVVQLMQTFNWHFQVVAEGAADTSILATDRFAVRSTADPSRIRSMAAGCSSDHWIYRQGKRCRYAGSSLLLSPTSSIQMNWLLTGGANEVALTMGLTTVSALAYLMFNLYHTALLRSDLVAMNSEMKSAKWLWGAIGLQLCNRIHRSIPGIPYRICHHRCRYRKRFRSWTDRDPVHGCDRDLHCQADPEKNSTKSMNYIRKERGQQRDKRHWGISACGDPRCSDYIHRKTEKKRCQMHWMSRCGQLFA